MTVQGRFVVCASILVGIAVLPLQTAALVEALLDFQKEGEGRRKKTTESDSWNLKSNRYNVPLTSETGDGKGSIVSSSTPLECYSIEQETQCVCTICSASPHRIDALFCWNCGSKLT